MQQKKVNTGKANDPNETQAEDHLLQNFREQAARAETRGDWQAAAHYYAQGMAQRSVELALINSVQEGLSSKSDMQAIYDLVGDKLRDTFNAQVVMISQFDPQTKKVFHHYAIERGQHLHIPGWHPIDASRSKIVETKNSLMINQIEIIALLEAQKMKVIPGTEVPKTWLGVPMLVGSEVRGIVSLQNLDIENAFSNSDIDLLTTLTNSMSQSLENARLFKETQRLLSQMEREMWLARQAQKNILPLHPPSHPGYDFGANIIPAQVVGGDFYDFIPMENQRVCIVIGDVSDKGLPAALFMAVTFSLVRAETGRGLSQAQIIENVNQFLIRINAQMFVTLLYCILDLRTGQVEYARAGHMPPIVIDQDGVFTPIAMTEGQPLGIMEQVQIDHQFVSIPNGGLMLLFSDGLSEALNAQDKMLGLIRVKEELLIHRHDRAQTICQNLWLAVENYTGEVPNQDDFTTVVIKRG